MPNKKGLFLLIILFFSSSVKPELILISKIKKERPPFSLKRNIFSLSFASSPPNSPAGLTDGQNPVLSEEQKKKNLEEEVRQSIQYDGYILRNSKKSAIINVSGEYFIVAEKDIVVDKIKIIQITTQTITIEFENQKYEVAIKGEGE